MRIRIIFAAVLALLPTSLYGGIIKVDQHGNGDFISIAQAIIEANKGDTIKVLPGNYDEQLNISKNIIIMGSGYEVTKISSNSDPTIEISAGKIMWFAITSTRGNGIIASGGIVANCVIQGCSMSGIHFLGDADATIKNCCILDNNYYGVSVQRGGGLNFNLVTKSSVVNSICFGNRPNDFVLDYTSYYNITYYGRSYCNGNLERGKFTTGNINLDPRFVDAQNGDLHLSDNSPCRDSGNPALLDPDGTRSDMGYYGGPDTPIFPIVTKIKLVPQEDGKIRLEATGIANW